MKRVQRRRRIATSGHCARGRGEIGSVLMLVPAGFLVLILLGALAVDSAAAYLGQQQLHDSLEAAANDAATAALSSQAFYARGAVIIDPAVAARSVCLDIASQSDRDIHGIQLWMAVEGPALRLRATATVDAVFGRAIPRFGQRHIAANAAAVVAGHEITTNGPSISNAPMVALSCA